MWLSSIVHFLRPGVWGALTGFGTMLVIVTASTVVVEIMQRQGPTEERNPFFKPFLKVLGRYGLMGAVLGEVVVLMGLPWWSVSPILLAGLICTVAMVKLGPRFDGLGIGRFRLKGRHGRH